MFLPNWSYDGADPGLRLFTLANPKLPSVSPLAEVLEVGAADTDFVERVNLTGMSAWGIDWRETKRPRVYRDNIMTRDFHCVDVAIGISSIEHIGLGHYDNDPVDPYGDIKTIQRLRDHVTDFIYFDVPYAPEGYWVKGTKCRIYDDQSLKERFGPHEVLGYTTGSVDGWIEKPTTNATGPRPYYYVALLVRKDADC